MEKHDNRLSVAIIGAGQIAGGFDQNKYNDEVGVYSHAGAYQKSGKFNLKTVVDIDKNKMMNYLKYWKVDCHAKSFEDICSRYHDVISVCTPDKTHHEIINALINNRCCKTIFAEKPLAEDLMKIKEIRDRAHENDIHVVVNFQRNFDKTYNELRGKFNKHPKNILTGNGYYMKGLNHIGTTMIDSLTAIFGYPKQIYAYNRIWNQEINEYTYEFIMYYDHFNITVKSIESKYHKYNYHVFEIDILFSDERIVIDNISRQIVKKEIIKYVYGGVNVLNDEHPKYQKTEYDISISKAVEYIYQITNEHTKHNINTPEHSYNNRLIVDKIIYSFEKNKKINIKEDEWIQ